MRYSFFILTIFILLMVPVLSCGNNRESDEPVFERVTGEMMDPLPETSGSPGEFNIEPLRTNFEQNPDDPDARFVYMTGLLRTGEYPEALEHCRVLAGLKGENPYRGVARLNFASIVLDHIPADSPDRPALLNEAKDYMFEGLGYEPESIPSHMAYGRLALETDDNDTALHHLSIALSAVEIGYELRADMAEIYIDKKDYAKAREHLEIALNLAEEADDRDEIGRIRRLMGQLE